jgi:hypothetical protein
MSLRADFGGRKNENSSYYQELNSNHLAGRPVGSRLTDCAIRLPVCHIIMGIHIISEASNAVYTILIPCPCMYSGVS